MNTAKRRNLTLALVILAALTATQIILSRFLSIATWNLKIGFGFIPVVVASVLYGPVGGGCVGAVSDFLGAILFPIGAYFPGFTATAALTGAVYGLLLKKKRTMGRIGAAVLFDQLIGSLLLNTLWISVISGTSFFAQLSVRIYQVLLMTAVQLIVISILDKILLGRVVRLGSRLRIGY